MVKPLERFDLVETWLNNVGARHSGSAATADHYKRHFNQFLAFIEATPEEIMEDYDKMSEKAFKRKYSLMLKAWISTLHREGYAPNTNVAKTTSVLSFFKYNNLPLGFIPTPRMRVTFHNRDITKDEIQKIIAISRPREKAFFTMMAQSGLRPVTLCALRMKHLEPDFNMSVIPCKVTVPQELAKGKYQGYLTFIAEEAVNALKAYFATRPNITEESPIFGGYGEETEQPRSVWIFTTKFREALQTLKQKGEIDYEIPPGGKPATLRLYNLRKWFRKMAHQAGFEIVQHWMGHVVKTGVDESYRPKDIEFHRRLYAEKAMPFLRLTMATPSETEQTIKRLEKQIGELRQENLELKQRLNGFTLSSDQVQELLRRIEKLEKQSQKQR